MQVTAAMVKALRDKTGLPMMDCKKALAEAGGDEQGAIELLRQAGLGRVSRMAGRATSQGRVACYLDRAGGRAGIVELRCESAPVASTGQFIALASALARHAAHMERPSAESLPAQPLLDDPSRRVADLVREVFDRVRENIRIARAGRLSGHVGAYLHHNGQVAVLVEMSADCPAELRTDLCMHIAAMNPTVVRRQDVAPAEVEKERSFFAAQASGKPQAIVERIVAGKLNRWFSEFVLLEQPFVKDDKKSVAQVLLGVSPSLTVRRFLRYEVGREG